MFVLIFFDFCGFLSVAYTTLNKLLAVFFIYNIVYTRGDRRYRDRRPVRPSPRVYATGNRRRDYANEHQSQQLV